MYEKWVGGKVGFSGWKGRRSRGVMERGKGVVVDEGRCGAPRPKREELLGSKLRRGISIPKRVGASTPVPTWKADEDAGWYQRRSTSNRVADFAVSARKLGANLWEIQDSLSVSRMSRRDGGRSRHRYRKSSKNLDLGEASPLGRRYRTETTGADGWDAAASLIQHHKLSARDGGTLQPVSPASYSSSMEMEAYNHAMTPTSSGLKGRLRETRYSLKTSNELLKILNQIWSLEEQHASNISIMKALKLELDHAKTRIHDLVEKRQVDRCEIDDLLKRLAENKNNLVGKSEWEKIKATVWSLKDEVEGERRLRKHFENLHQKVAKEFSEVKPSYSKTLMNLQKEKKVRALLEDLCDLFAKGIVEYEHEVRELKQKSDIDFVPRFDNSILQISERWLDNQLQMNLAESHGDFAEVNTINHRLGCEIENLVQSRRSNAFGDCIMTKKDSRVDNYIHRQSLESVHLNGANSAPQDAEDDDSVASDLNCNDHRMGSNYFTHSNFKNSKEVIESLDARKSNIGKNVRYAERIVGQSPSDAQLQFEERNERTRTSMGNKVQFADRVQGIHLHHRGKSGGDSKYLEFLIGKETDESGQWNCPIGSHIVVENSSKHQQEISNDSMVKAGNDLSWRGQQSTAVSLDTTTGDIQSVAHPVQQRKYLIAPPDTEKAESSSKLRRGVKENTLKAKLLEARLERQHARLRTSIGSSGC